MKIERATSMDKAIEDLNLLEQYFTSDLKDYDIQDMRDFKIDFIQAIRVGRLAIRQSIERIENGRKLNWETGKEIEQHWTDGLSEKEKNSSEKE